jgi:PilZ domain
MLSNTSVSETEDRRTKRIGLALPIRIEGKVNKTVAWSEITRLQDVSAFGAAFNLNRPIKRGRLVAMTMPMPRQLRCYDHLEPQYRIWGLVRRCIPVENSINSEQYAVGVAFIGKFPPSSYIDNPAKIFEITQLEEKGFWKVVEAPENPDERDLPKELRRHSRYQIPVNILLETLDDEGNVHKTETTVTENISLGGASVFTSLDADVGAFIRVSSEQYNSTIISVVRGKRLGPDSIPRLHLEFIDHLFPLQGIE